MGFLSGLIAVAVDVVALPVAVVADVLTAGQAGITKKVAKELEQDADDLLTGNS